MAKRKEEVVGKGLAENSGARTVKKEVTYNINVTVQGDGLSAEAMRQLEQKLAEEMRQIVRQEQAEREEFEMIKEGLAA